MGFTSEGGADEGVKLLDGVDDTIQATVYNVTNPTVQSTDNPLAVHITNQSTEPLPINLTDNPKKGKFISVHLRNGSSDNMNVDGSSTPVTFSAGPVSGKKWFISRAIIVVVDSDVAYDEFGGLGIVLTNGVAINYMDNGVVYDLLDGDTIKSNTDFIQFCYDGTIDHEAKDLFKVRWTFSKSGTFLQLLGSTTDLFKCVVNDDLTGLDEFEIILQGYEVDE